MYKGRDGRQINAIGVRIERNDRHCVVYRGTRAALIEAGLASTAHFPDASKRFTWHFPKSGTNWGIRRRTGGVYSLTKLKDKQGLVDAELKAFSRAALTAARADSGFRRFMDRVQSAEPMPSHNEPASLTFTPWPEGRARAAGGVLTASPGGLETIAVATLVFGLTIYLWSRQR
jgi:hypothetical protein